MHYECRVSKLFKRNQGVWGFRFKKSNGDWAEKSTGMKEKGDAREFQKNFITEMEAQEVPSETAKWTLSRAVTEWLEMRKSRVAERTWKAERSRLRSLVKNMGDQRLGAIRLSDFEKYQTVRLGQRVGPWSVNKELMLLRLILKRMKLWRGELREEYQRTGAVPPLRTEVSDIGRALTRDELRVLVGSTNQNPEWSTTMYGMVLAANTGLRGEEVRQLRLGSIDLESHVLTVRRRTTKSNSGARQVPLNADALEAATRLIERAQELGSSASEHFLLPANLSKHTKPGDPLCGRHGFDPTVNQRGWKTSWDSLTRAAGFEGLNFHALRHTFITHMVEHGVSIEHIMTVVGHVSARMVRHYTHIASGVLRRDLAILDSDPILRRPSTGTGMLTVN